MKPKILIVEDQFIEAHALQLMLVRAGYMVCDLARSVSEALSLIQQQAPELVLIDIFLQGKLTGIDLAVKLREKHIPFVYLSANSNQKILEEAKTTRPNGFLVKPFREVEVLMMLEIAWHVHRETEADLAKKERRTDRYSASQNSDERRMLWESSQMQEVAGQIKIAANASISVLILGESGTGKELVARDIHRLSERSDRPFVAMNCAALPSTLVESEFFGHEKGAFTGALERRAGKFEKADGGTIFLDEIGELPLEMQSKLLRTLQEREIEPIGGSLRKVDVRVIAATNRNLEEEISRGNFRMDLYFRLNIFPILLPPLRERLPDIPLLADHFIGQYARELGKEPPTLSKQARQELLKYSWPGNVRELENVMHKSVLMTNEKTISTLNLSAGALSVPTVRARLDTIVENERNHILAALEKCRWRVAGESGAAALLDIKVSTLTSRMKKLGIRRP